MDDVQRSTPNSVRRSNSADGYHRRGETNESGLGRLSYDASEPGIDSLTKDDRKQKGQETPVTTTYDDQKAWSDDEVAIEVRRGIDYQIRENPDHDYYPDETDVHVLYEDSPRAHQPPIIWTASVFNNEYDGTLANDKPTAIYENDKPLGIAVGTKAKDEVFDRHETHQITDDVQSAFHPAWEGCVFQINCKALARFPRSHETASALRIGISGEGLPSAKRSRIITERLESVQFDHISRNTISIYSPFLYRRLRIIAGYYPSFFTREHSSLLELTHTNASSIRTPHLISDPWGILFHRFADIEKFVASEPKSDESNDTGGKLDQAILRLEYEHTLHLYKFLKPRFDARILQCQKKLEMPLPQLSFDMLWYAFPPGVDVYVKKGPSAISCVISKISSNLDDDEYSPSQISQMERKFWILEMWNLDTDGRRVGRVMLTRRIYAYSGTQELTSLEICPASVWDAFDDGHLLARYEGPVDDGKRQYNGNLVIDCRRGLVQSRMTPPMLGRVRDFCSNFDHYNDILVAVGEDSSEDVIVDTNEEIERARSRPRDYRADDYDLPRRYRERSPIQYGQSDEAVYNRTVTDSKSRRVTSYTDPSLPYIEILGPASEQQQAPLAQDLSDHQLLLLSPYMPAFALKTKQWLTIHADYLSETAPSEDSIVNLVLDPDELKTIRAMSTRQNSKRDVWAADFIEGKGTGQILLLHGPPGVGKTYTVEAIAELLHRPLLALTVADIGTVETRVERELMKWFSLAEAWDAVLLVDEADIFLERRQNRDLARNGLVSAFLRRMEYFKGLLFLTTNRVGQIDDAFISRVHVAIGYKTLSGNDREKIWKGFFKKLVKERTGKIQISTSARNWVLEKARLGNAQLNGRDIRNALQTAITLAEAESEEDPDFDPVRMPVVVDRAHFERVLDISNKFHEYVKSIRREDEKKRAALRSDRNDYYWTTEAAS